MDRGERDGGFAQVSHVDQIVERDGWTLWIGER